MCLLVCCISNAQNDESNNVSESTYIELKKELGLDKTKKVIRPKESDRKKKEKKEKKNNGGFTFGGGGLISAFLYLLIGAMFIAILYLVFSNIKMDDTRLDLPKESKEIEDLSELDPDEEIKKALAIGDFRGAIRMHFYKVLKILDGKRIIDWTKEKTNRDFLREINEKRLKREFRNLATVFEFAWYGNKEVNQEAYTRIEQSFIAFYNSKEQ